MNEQSNYVVPIETHIHGVNITQGFNGPWSHFDHKPKYNTNIDLSYAVDFGVPFDSIVTAARDGIVSLVWDESEDYYEGSDPAIGNTLSVTNAIIVMHSDGTRGVYSHLGPRSALVKQGERVTAHQPLAHTGKSGWVAKIPHLHFHVDKGLGPLKTIPFSFNDYEGPLLHSIINQQRGQIQERLIGF